MSGQGQITRLLADWSGGKQAALDSLVRIVYDELRRLASVYMRGERPDHLLQTTALVNEAYLRLVERQHVNCQTRTQFFAVAAQVTRRVLVDYARGRDRAKRGDGAAPFAVASKRADARAADGHSEPLPPSAPVAVHSSHAPSASR